MIFKVDFERFPKAFAIFFSFLYNVCMFTSLLWSKILLCLATLVRLNFLKGSYFWVFFIYMHHYFLICIMFNNLKTLVVLVKCPPSPFQQSSLYYLVRLTVNGSLLDYKFPQCQHMFYGKGKYNRFATPISKDFPAEN